MDMKKLVEQIVKFAFVGGTAFIIDYFGMIFLTEVLHINYLISSVISFTLSVIYNYILSVRWVFTVNNQLSAKKQFIIFVLLSVVGLVLNTLLMWVFTDLAHLDYRIGKIIATVLVMVYNFISRKMFLESKD